MPTEITLIPKSAKELTTKISAFLHEEIGEKNNLEWIVVVARGEDCSCNAFGSRAALMEIGIRALHSVLDGTDTKGASNNRQAEPTAEEMEQYLASLNVDDSVLLAHFVPTSVVDGPLQGSGRVISITGKSIVVQTDNAAIVFPLTGEVAGRNVAWNHAYTLWVPIWQIVIPDGWHPETHEN